MVILQGCQCLLDLFNTIPSRLFPPHRYTPQDGFKLRQILNSCNLNTDQDHKDGFRAGLLLAKLPD